MSVTINGSTASSYWTFKLVATEGTPNESNNTSPLTVQVYIGRSANVGGSYMWGASISCPVNVTGCATQTITYKNSGQVNIAAGGWLLIGSTTFSAVPHNADGSKTVTVSASFTNNVSPASGNASGSVTLTTIARASQPSCITWPEHTQNVGSFGDTISIHMNRKSENFTHTVRYAFGSRTGTIATGVETGTTWKIPLDFMNLLPKATSGSGTIYVDTYNGSKQIGTKYCGFTATVPASVKPTCSVQVLDATDTQKTYGSLVKGLSKLYIKITGTPAYSSPIKSYASYVYYDTKAIPDTYTGAENTTGLLEYAGKVFVDADVVDNRNRTSARASASFPVLDYKEPSVTALSVHRCNEDGTENDQGEYIQVTFSGSITPLNNKNSATYTLGYKKSTATNFTEVPLSDLTGEYAVSDYSYIFAADSDYSYDIQITAEDDVKAVPRSTSASTGFTFMDWNDDGRSIAFGKVSEESGAMENALTLRQIGNRYAFSSPGVANQSGYVLMAQLTHVAANADTPLTFVFTRRLEATPMTVHVQFRTDSTTVDPELKGITYEGSNYGAFLVKSATSVWDLYVQKVSAYDTITLQDWYSSRTIKGRLQVTFPGTHLSELPQGQEGWYRATPAKLQSILDYVYPVGSIYFSYSHVSPAELFGGTWERIENAFLWACDEKGAIGQTGGEKTHTLTVEEMPKHNHGAYYTGTATTKTHPWQSGSGSNLGYGVIDAGGGKAHNNMPPYIQVAVWRRTA